MLIEKSIFLQKKSRKHKFYMLFFTFGILVVAIVLFNLNLHDWHRPPNLWITLWQLQCPLTPPTFIGMHSTFLDTSILICVPSVIFAASFSQQTLLAFRHSKNQYPRATSALNLIIGISMSALIDRLFQKYPLYSTAYQYD